MDWNNEKLRAIFSEKRRKGDRRQETTSSVLLVPCSLFLFSCLLLTACSVSYSFQGGKVNYDVVKTITIREFPNRTPFYPELAQIFDQALRNRYIEQTRLTPVANNGDIEIEGEITGFNTQNMAVREDAYASLIRLTITVHVKYTNNKEANSDVDQSFSASREYDATRSLDEVQDQLSREIVGELIDMIYNATIANW